MVKLKWFWVSLASHRERGALRGGVRVGDRVQVGGTAPEQRKLTALP